MFNFKNKPFTEFFLLKTDFHKFFPVKNRLVINLSVQNPNICGKNEPSEMFHLNVSSSQNVSSQKWTIVKNVQFQKRTLHKILPTKNGLSQIFSCEKWTCDKPFRAKSKHLWKERTVWIIKHVLLSSKWSSPCASCQRCSLIHAPITAGQKKWVWFHCWQ